MEAVTGLLLGQLDFYLETHLFPRLEGLEDEEYFWEPVPDCWSVVGGPGGWVMQQSWPEPSPPPLTTIAWLPPSTLSPTPTPRTSSTTTRGAPERWRR